ncbi:unnamed protein product, partial [Brenthis ino]
MSLLPVTNSDPPASEAVPQNHNVTLKLKKQLDDTSIWMHDITLEDMNSIKNSTFEFENSHSYHVYNYDTSKLTQSLIAKEQTVRITVGEEDLTLNNLLCEEEMLPSCLDYTFLENSDDSVKDKDYFADFDLHVTSSSSSFTLNDIGNDDERETRDITNIENDRDFINVSVSQRKKTSLTQINRAKHEKLLIKYPLREPCHNLCKKLCTFNFSEKDRQDIHEYYWSLDWEHRGIYIKNLVTEKDCVKKGPAKTSKRKRQVTYTYNFPKDEGRLEVCRTFFLCTLGYAKKNDRHVLSVLNKSIIAQKDQRDGRNLKLITVDKELITQHVESFKPCVHHYRRAHAPNKKYLPSDLTITDMHKNFLETHPEIKCSIETYRNHLTNVMNISFAKLGHEECEMCETFNLHNSEHVKNGYDSLCEVCNSHSKHKLKYKKAREIYERDAKEQCQDEIHVSVDLQKVIMLPRIDSFKSTLFCPRLVVYNETFVPLGKFKDSGVFAAVWHEGISGRKQEDIVSTFRAFLLNKRDAKKITLWLDNCSAQNKNWCLLTFLIQIINSSDIGATQIVIKYFEPGHTFMSADSFHHSVEQSLRKKGKIYDFRDFVNAVTQSLKSGKVVSKIMEVTDFYNYKSHVAQNKVKDKEGNRVYLRDIVEVLVQRGKHCLFYKKDFNETDYRHMFCLKSKTLPIFSQRTGPKGIDLQKKHNIIKQLGTLMPENRLLFWKNLPISKNDTTDEILEFDVDE